MRTTHFVKLTTLEGRISVWRPQLHVRYRPHPSMDLRNACGTRPPSADASAYLW